MRLLIKAIELDPDDDEANRLLLTAAQRGSRVPELIQVYRQITDRFPDRAVPFDHWGGVYFMMGDLQSAREMYVKAKTLDPQLVSPRNNLALIASFYGRYDQSIEEFERCLQLNPNISSAHGSLGLDYQRIGRMDQALIHLQRAVELEPIGFRMNNLAHYHFVLGDYGQARVWYEKALEQDPTGLTMDTRHVQSLLNLSQCCLKHQDYDRCNQILDMCFAMPGADHSMDLHKRAGKVYFEQGLYGRSLQCYEQALILSVGNELVQDVIYRHISMVYYRMGEFHRATAAFQLASFCRQSTINFDTDWLAQYEAAGEDNGDVSQPVGAFRHALTLYRQGHWEAAAAELQSAMALNPERNDIYMALGWINLLLDNMIEAWKHIFLGIYHRCDAASFLLAGMAALLEGSYGHAAFYVDHALELNSHSVHAWRCRGDVYRCSGNYDAAARCYEKVLELDPQVSDVHYHLADICRRTGCLDEAISHLQRLLATHTNHALGLELLSNLEYEVGQVEQAEVTRSRLQRINPHLQLIRQGGSHC